LIILGAQMPARAEEASRCCEFDPFLLTGGGFLFTNKTGEVHDVISGGGIKFWRCAPGCHFKIFGSVIKHRTRFTSTVQRLIRLVSCDCD
jgi:hypothetical protein